MFLCYCLLHSNNLYYVKSSNIILGLVTKIAVHFYTDFTSWLLKQIWLFPYPHGYCNPFRIHGMKINIVWCDNLRMSFRTCWRHNWILCMTMCGGHCYLSLAEICQYCEAYGLILTFKWAGLYLNFPTWFVKIVNITCTGRENIMK